MGASYEVLIERGGRFCEIEPGELFVNTNDTVTFVNKTRARVRIFFGGSVPLGKELIDLGPGDHSEPLLVKPPEKKLKSYQYAVYSAELKAFGVGGSNPRIIIMQ
jgi:hypothetical protein